MASYSPQATQKSIPTQQPIYPPRYPPNNNAPFINPNINAQQQGGYPYPQQYPPQYPPQPNYQQQQYYQTPNQYQNYPPTNNPYPPQDPYNQYGQYPQQNQPSQQTDSLTTAPPPIPQNSPLLRHRMSQILGFISKNRQQFSQDFNKKFQENEDFRSLNRKVVFFPSILIASHVIMNRKKKWFRLTVNAPLIRYSLLGLFMLHISTNILYVAAFRDLIARNREKIEKIVVREEFLGSGNK